MDRYQLNRTMARADRLPSDPLLAAVMAWATLALIFAGCGTPTRESESSSPPATVHGHMASQELSPLVGIWLGQASIDRAALDQHLIKLDSPEERKRVEVMARSFESIAVGLEFRSDGSMEVEMEILPPESEPVRESSVGLWNVLARDGQVITVSCREVHGQSASEPQVVRYDFSSDYNQMSTVAPVGPELEAFQPRIVFERREATDVAQQPSDSPTLLR